MANISKADRTISSMDARDRLIAALYAQLRAERETRETFEWVIGNDGLSDEVLEAIAGDPVPVVTSENVAAVEKITAFDSRRKKTERQTQEVVGRKGCASWLTSHMKSSSTMVVGLTSWARRFRKPTARDRRR